MGNESAGNAFIAMEYIRGARRVLDFWEEFGMESF